MKNMTIALPSQHFFCTESPEVADLLPITNHDLMNITNVKCQNMHSLLITTYHSVSHAFGTQYDSLVNLLILISRYFSLLCTVCNLTFDLTLEELTCH